MTRRQPLRVLLPNTVSHAVMDFVGHPFMFRFGLDGAYQDCRESSLERVSTPAWAHYIDIGC